MNRQKAYLLGTTLLCALVMSFVDGVIQPPYAVKSALKILLFLCVPLVYFGIFRAWGGALILLTAAGLILNALNERSGSILTSWLLHMCANLAINTVGFYVFGML